MDVHLLYIATVFTFVFFVVQCHAECHPPEWEQDDDDYGFLSMFNDSQLEIYVQQTLVNFRGSMKTGVQSMNIPKLDPLKVKDRIINTTLEVGKLGTEFKSLLVRGLSGFNVRSVHVDRYSPEMQLSLAVKFVSLTGHYIMNGIIRETIKVRNHGRFHVDSSDAVFSANARLSTDQTGHVILTRLILDMEFPLLNVFFDAQMSGSEIRKYLKDTLDSYGRQLFDLAKPALLHKLQAAFQRVINAQLAMTSADDYLIKSRNIS